MYTSQKLTLHLLLATAAVVTLSDPALSQSYTNESGGSVTFYGQVDPAYQSVDDGVETTDTLVDNAGSNTRVGFWLEQPMGTGTLKFNFETSFGIIASDKVSQDFTPDGFDWDKTKLRKLELIYSGDFGKVSAGQGSMATDGVAGADFSGTSLVGSQAIGDAAGGFKFRDGDDNLTDISIGSAFDNLDGSRRWRLRYDTPELSNSGISFAVAYGKEELKEDDRSDYYDAAVLYEKELGDFEVEAALGYAWKDNEGDLSENYVGSISAIHTPTGLNFTIAGGAEADDGGSYGYYKLGWKADDLVSVGSTAFAAEYYASSGFGADDGNAVSWGVSVVQKFDDQKLEAYLGWRQYAFEDDSGADYQDMSSILVGARWKF